MILSIREYPDPILRAPCAPVKGYRSDLADSMLDTLYAANGRGLAAPQVGISERLFVMDCTWKDQLPEPRVFVNPVMVERDGEVPSEERCLSVPKTTRRVARAKWVVLEYDTREGRRRERFGGTQAIIVQHEMDHLDGVLLVDHPELPAEEDADA